MLLWLYPRDPLILLLPPLRHLHLHPLVTPPVHLHLLGQNRHSIAERAEVNAAISCKAPFAIIHVTLSESYENMLSSLQHSYSLCNFIGWICLLPNLGQQLLPIQIFIFCIHGQKNLKTLPRAIVVVISLKPTINLLKKRGFRLQMNHAWLRTISIML